MLWTYQLTQKDPNRPWIILSTEQGSVELPDEQPFAEFARQWSGPEWEVEASPGLTMQWITAKLEREKQ